MTNDIVENIQVLGPAFAGIWILTVGLTLLRPQRYFNSFLLMLALMVTMIFLSGFFKRPPERVCKLLPGGL